MWGIDGVEVGKRVAALRADRKWSQRQLAAKAGVSHSYVSHLEKGIYPQPGEKKLSLLAGALGVPVSQLNIQREGGFETSSGIDSGRILTALQALIPESMTEGEGTSYMYQMMTNLEILMDNLDDIPALINMWAHLNVGDMVAVADMIAVAHLRQRNNLSGKVRRMVFPERQQQRLLPPAVQEEGPPPLILGSSPQGLEREGSGENAG